MAARASLDDKLAALRELRGRALTPPQKADLRKSLGDRSNLVVASAAAIAGESTLVEMARDLEAAFERFQVNPLKDDKLCRAKIAIVQALDRMEHQDPGVFLKAARYVQLEPVWGGSEDSAPPLACAAALVALARTEGSSCLPLLVDALVDPAKDVRIASAVAIGAVGTDGAGLVLRLKVRVGDRDPDVFSECLGGLLKVDPKENLPLVTGFLEPGDSVACEAAALALGKSRLPEALDPLRECWQRSHSPELRRHVLLAIAILRRLDAIDHLMELVSSEPEPSAIDALSVLKIYRDDPHQRERIAGIVRERRSPTLQAWFDRDFRSAES